MTEFPIIDTQQQLGNKIQKQSVKQLQKPKGLSLFRRLEWILDPVTYLERTQTQLPDFFEEDSLGFGVGPTVIASHPEAIQYILSRDRKLFKAPGEFNRILAPLIGDTSAIMLSGEQHKTRRRLMAPAFHGDRLEVYGQLICQLTHERVNALATGEAFAARDLTQQISLQTIAKVVLGFADGPNSQTMLDILTETADGFGSPVSAMLLFFNSLQKDLGAWSPWGRFLQLRRQLDELLYAEIDERLQTPDPSRTDNLSMLMASRTEAGEALSKEELRDELMALLLALAANIGVGTMVGSFRTTFTGWLDQRLAAEFYVNARDGVQGKELKSWLAERTQAVLPIVETEAMLGGRKGAVFGVADHGVDL